VSGGEREGSASSRVFEGVAEVAAPLTTGPMAGEISRNISASHGRPTRVAFLVGWAASHNFGGLHCTNKIFSFLNEANRLLNKRKRMKSNHQPCHGNYNIYRSHTKKKKNKDHRYIHESKIAGYFFQNSVKLVIVRPSRLVPWLYVFGSKMDCTTKYDL